MVPLSTTSPSGVEACEHSRGGDGRVPLADGAGQLSLFDRTYTCKTVDFTAPEANRVLQVTN
ncbi:hypothetical protein CBOM_08080 [Ceraceosorus bombacis]|uniref:Uncharacterized protein n=1 Tax=Ceraceosorus bombacis TaxID=401625 RepID=A0A0P1BTW1_9BASI|nr:hypothetical protein CBOM_08080 [Ceraceosorus bombacis]